MTFIDMDIYTQNILYSNWYNTVPIGAIVFWYTPYGIYCHDNAVNYAGGAPCGCI